MKENAWKKYSNENRQVVFDFCDDYKDFMSKCKTERECVEEFIRIASSNGYRDINEYIESNTPLKPGDKVYANNYGKTIALFVIGNEPLSKGMKILGAHIDSPRMDLKQNPLYEDKSLALLDTHYYGGIKKYQWTALPLALHGVVCKKDGTTVNVVIGEDDDDPIVEVSDLLIHLSKAQMEKPTANAIEGEALNLLVGSIPLEDTEKDATKANILKLLKEKYDIEEEDFISAEIEVVPAGKARDCGLDKSMIMAYGQDDRVCAYTSLMALMEIESVDRTCCCILSDKEEIGSVGVSGMQSRFFENTIAELINLTTDYNDILLRRCLSNSVMLSSDVSAAYDPNYPNVNELKNTAFFGQGIALNKYLGRGGKSGSNDANAEYVAKLRAIMEKNEVCYQTAELGSVDAGGGGTIAGILANLNIQVIDSGIPVQNMHAPYEVSCKVDIYEAKRGYLAFLLDA